MSTVQREGIELPASVSVRVPDRDRHAGSAGSDRDTWELQAICVVSTVILVIVCLAAAVHVLGGSWQHFSMLATLSVTLAAWAAVEWHLLAYRHPNREVKLLGGAVYCQGVASLLVLAFAWSEKSVSGSFPASRELAASAITVLLFAFLLVAIILLTIRIFVAEQRQRALSIEYQMLTSLNSLSLARDNETGNHILRTQRYVRALAMRLRSMGQYTNQLTGSVIENMCKAAPLHDIGKVGIPDHILLKPGKLSTEEWAVMQTHAVIGETVLGGAEMQTGHSDDVLHQAMLIAGGHHEKWNGTGYPRRLSGTAIPLPARIMALADTYDALVSARVYKKAWTHESAVDEIRRNSGTHFDPAVVDAFLAEHESFREANALFADTKQHETLARIEEPSVARLRRADEKFRVLFNNTPLGMAMIDYESGDFLEVNDCLLQDTGYTRSEFLKLSFWDLTPDSYGSQEAAQIEELDRTGRFTPRTKEYIRKDGTRFPIRIRGFMVIDTDGRKLVWGLIENLLDAPGAAVIPERPRFLKDANAGPAA